MKHIYTTLILFSAILMGNYGWSQCQAPTTLWDEDGTSINWIPNENATSHIVRYRATGTFDWMEVEVQDSFFSIATFESCQQYDFRVRSVCGDEQSNFSPTYSTFANCGTCFDEYCDIPQLQEFGPTINYVRVNEYENASTSSGFGYEDFRGGLDIVLGPNNEAEIEVGVDADFYYSDFAQVYIDFNRDLEFTPDEQVLSGQITPAENIVATFTVPADIDFGITRMRVMVFTDYGYGGADICEEVYGPFSGEIEEYCVLLGELPSACDINFDLLTEEVTQELTTFTWEMLEAAAAYNFRFKKVSDPETEWNEFATIQPFAELGDLDDCTEYEFEVRGVCPFDTSGYANNRVVFDSYCPTGANEDEFLFTEITTYPNPWMTNMTLKLTSKESSRISVMITDTEGKQFDLVNGAYITQGENQISFDNTSHFPAGIYVLKITNEENRSWYRKTLKIQ